LRRYFCGDRQGEHRIGQAGFEIVASHVFRPWQQRGDLIEPQGAQLVRYAVPVAQVAATHDADEQRFVAVFVRDGPIRQAFRHRSIPG
jgi:hypothetical protein